MAASYDLSARHMSVQRWVLWCSPLFVPYGNCPKRYGHSYRFGPSKYNKTVYARLRVAHESVRRYKAGLSVCSDTNPHAVLSRKRPDATPGLQTSVVKRSNWSSRRKNMTRLKIAVSLAIVTLGHIRLRASAIPRLL